MSRLLGLWPLAVVLIGVVLAAVGILVPGIVLALVGLALFVAAWRAGDPRRLLARLSTRPADEREERLVNLVEALCVASGLPLPGLAVLEDDAANAIVLGTSAADATVVVTTGLLERLDRMELEALLAHELAHVKQGDLSALCQMLRAYALFAPFWQGTGLAARRAGGVQRESFADLAAVRLTRYPPALSAALEKLANAPLRRPSGLDVATARLTAALWCAPLEEASSARTLQGGLDLTERAAALREL